LKTAATESGAKGRSPGILAGILAFGAVSRLLYLLAHRRDPFSTWLIHDAARYHDWAKALASGKLWEPGAFYQAPLYPALLAATYGLCGARILAGTALNLALGILTLLLIHRIATRAYGREAGLAAAGIASLYGTFVFYETKLLPAALTVCLAALLVDRMQAADAAERNAGWIVAGAALGAAALAAPGLLLMGAAGGVWILLDRGRGIRGRLARLAWLGAGALLVVAPVTIRNHAASGEWVLIASNGGITFYQGNNPNALGVFSNPPGFSGVIATQRAESRRLAEARTGRQMGDAAVSRFWFGKGIDYLAADPAHAAALLAAKALLALANNEQPLEYNPRLDRNPFRWLMPVTFGLILALAAVRIHGRCPGGTGRRAEHPILLLLLADGAVLLAFYVSGRYRLPAAPGLIALAGCGSVLLARRLREGGGGTRRGAAGAAISRAAAAPLATAALVALFSFAYVPITHAALGRQQMAMGLVDRSEALWGAGRRPEAIADLRRAVTLDPSFSGARVNLGRALMEEGKTGEAERILGEAVRLDPGSAEARFDLGVLRVGQGRLDAAAALFEEAHRLDPGNASAANNLLGVLIQIGRIDRAREVRREMRARGLAVDPTLERALGQDAGGATGGGG
jgi:pentatricopeptide repeat protein